jgi:hypothetical protein
LEENTAVTGRFNTGLAFEEINQVRAQLKEDPG